MVARKKPVEGHPRPYMRDGVPGLPIERQEEILAALGLDLSEGKIYVDRISRKRISARPPLPMRDQVISPDHSWQRGETIYLPSLRVLDWDNLGTMRAASIAFEKHCRIFCADTGELYTGETSAADLLKALTRAEEARRRARTSRGTEGATSRKKARVEMGLAIARRHWDGPRTTKDIAAEAKLSTRTLHTHLGGRSEPRDEKRKGKKHA